MRYLVIFALIAAAAAVAPTASAETFRGTTSGGTLDVAITPGDEGFKMEFVNPASGATQIHIDYKVSVIVEGEYVFGPIPLTHTSPGMVTIPAVLEIGTNQINVEVSGILFMPIEEETLTIEIIIGAPESIPEWIKINSGWWASGLIDDETFLTGIQYLIADGVIVVEVGNVQDGESDGNVPSWVKAIAEWWANGELNDDEFLGALKFLIETGAITIPTEPEPPVLGGVDLRYAPAYGDEDAPVAIIEFGDYQCPNCRNWFVNTRPAIFSEFVEPGTAVLYFVDFVFIGPDSAGAAQASYCAEEQGMYWEYHDTLYQSQGPIDSGWASTANLEGFAADLGMDVEAFQTCVFEDDGSRIEFNRMQAEASGVDRTPSFVIVGPGGVEMILGNQPYQTFERAVLEVLE